MVKNITIDKSEHINEWDYKKNSELSLNAKDITLGSSVEAYWKCFLEDHSYPMKIYNKKMGKNCPYCFGNKVLEGFNDLLSKIPENAKYWSEKNLLKASKVYYNSNIEYMFKCPNCENEWKQQLHKFNGRKNKCPECYKKNRTLIIKNNKNIQRVQKMFSPKNTISFNEINVKDCRNKYFWNCSLNHEWSSTPYNIINNKGCPYCAYRKILKGFNDLESKEPEVAKYFDEKANGVKASEVSHKSTGISYKWMKIECGHSWTNKISRQVANNYCKICLYGEKDIVNGINDIFTIYPKLKELFIHELNDNYLNYYKNSNKIIKTYCSDRLHITELKLSVYGGGEIKCSECLVLKNSEKIKNKAVKREKYLRKIEANKLIKIYPKSVFEWSNFNEDINNFTTGSKKSILFNCKDCGGFYEMQIRSRFRTDREFNCKICNGKKICYGINDLETFLLKKEFLSMLEEYAYCNGMNSSEIFYNSKNRVKWNCNKCKKFYRRSPHERLVENKHCQYCSKSFGEKELLNFIKTIYHGEISNGDHSIITPYELDIYLPELNLAIEYNGNYWHSDKKLIERVGMDSHSYHSMKYGKCLAKNILLIYVWDYDWLNSKENMKTWLISLIERNFINEKLLKFSHSVEK